MQCRSPRCTDAAAEQERFCQPHLDIFAKMRQEIEDGKEQRLRSAGVRKRKRLKHCTFYECEEPRKPGEEVCLYHLALRAR